MATRNHSGRPSQTAFYDDEEERQRREQLRELRELRELKELRELRELRDERDMRELREERREREREREEGSKRRSGGGRGRSPPAVGFRKKSLLQRLFSLKLGGDESDEEERQQYSKHSNARRHTVQLDDKTLADQASVLAVDSDEAMMAQAASIDLSRDLFLSKARPSSTNSSPRPLARKSCPKGPDTRKLTKEINANIVHQNAKSQSKSVTVQSLPAVKGIYQKKPQNNSTNNNAAGTRRSSADKGDGSNNITVARRSSGDKVDGGSNNITVARSSSGDKGDVGVINNNNPNSNRLVTSPAAAPSPNKARFQSKLQRGGAVKAGGLKTVSGSFKRRSMKMGNNRGGGSGNAGGGKRADVSKPLVFPNTPEAILDYHKQKPFLDQNEEWLVVELNEYECLVDSLAILKIIAKHSKFFEVEPDELWQQFFDFVDELPAYDEVINFDIWQEFRDKKYAR